MVSTRMGSSEPAIHTGMAGAIGTLYDRLSKMLWTSSMVKRPASSGRGTSFALVWMRIFMLLSSVRLKTLRILARVASRWRLGLGASSSDEDEDGEDSRTRFRDVMWRWMGVGWCWMGIALYIEKIKRSDRMTPVRVRKSFIILSFDFFIFSNVHLCQRSFIKMTPLRQACDSGHFS